MKCLILCFIFLGVVLLAGVGGRNPPWWTPLIFFCGQWIFGKAHGQWPTWTPWNFESGLEAAQQPCHACPLWAGRGAEWILNSAGSCGRHQNPVAMEQRSWSGAVKAHGLESDNILLLHPSFCCHSQINKYIRIEHVFFCFVWVPTDKRAIHTVRFREDFILQIDIFYVVQGPAWLHPNWKCWGLSFYYMVWLSLQEKV